MFQAAENRSVTSLQVRKLLARTIIILIAYFVAGELGQATTRIRSGNIGPVWPAIGVSLAAILLCGYRAWVGVAIGAFLVEILSPVPFLAAIGQAAAATLAALSGAFPLRRIARFQTSLARLRDALALIGGEAQHGKAYFRGEHFGSADQCFVLICAVSEEFGIDEMVRKQSALRLRFSAEANGSRGEPE